MPDTAETVRAMTERMLDEELTMILDKLASDQPLTILQGAVVQEAVWRELTI